MKNDNPGAVTSKAAEARKEEANKQSASRQAKRDAATPKQAVPFMKLTSSEDSPEHQYTVVKRTGILVPFRKDRIVMVLEAAFRDTKKIEKDQPLSKELQAAVKTIVALIVEDAAKLASKGACLTVEGIQDIVERKLMEAGHHDVARDYIVYRDKHKKLRDDSPRNFKVLRRDGKSIVRFNPIKIASAIERAFRDTHRIVGPTPDTLIEHVGYVTDKVVSQVVVLVAAHTELHVELIQDVIERQLMIEGFYEVAKDFILYRAERAERRAKEDAELVAAPLEEAPVADKAPSTQRTFIVTALDGSRKNVTEGELLKTITFACQGLEKTVSADGVLQGALTNFYEGIRLHEVDLSLLMACKAKIEVEPAYSQVAARLLLNTLYRETMGVEVSAPDLEKKHQQYFRTYLEKAITVKRVNPALREFDLEKLAKTMDLKRDLLFGYLGLQTLYDRYFIHDDNQRLETPQIFWMRVAMGVALNEGDQKTEKAIEFYNILSQFLYTAGTPTLFNSGTLHSQLSSCYLSTVMDDLPHIFKVISDDAQLSKWAGGIGNDWTNVRATGAIIRGTNGVSQGVIPFLKVANDTAVAVNQGGKRKGAMCAYLETWHLDIEDFLELRKNTGDERRRTHDMNTANWIPDLFMQRVKTGGMWTLFSPNNVPDLHDLYGKAFENRYVQYEAMAERGEIKVFKKIEALQLWRKMLSMLFETGHPWITFKDPSNIRSPQDHVGVIHSSNLCTEILLNTSAEETAVCNLGSINLALHTTPKGLNEKLLASTIKTAMRMLDNVIDYNFYSVPTARASNLRHRPVGLGIMGFNDCLYQQRLAYGSSEAVAFADTSMEAVSYFAIKASTNLAVERGAYPSFEGSLWSRGILPIDSLDLLEKSRGGYFDVDRSSTLNWDALRDRVVAVGMRNSNCLAIAPTATISNICGVSQSIEPTYQNLYVKSNLSGEFTVVNMYLVDDLKAHGLWDEVMVNDLKYYDGSVAQIDRIPRDLKELYATSFEVDPRWLVEAGSRRQKWLDQAQSLNLYLAEPNGAKLDNLYKLAWVKGLKTTYYLRTMGATHVEKSTLKDGKLNAVYQLANPASGEAVAKACLITDPDCEACQ